METASIAVRFAQAEDMPTVCGIVNHYIETTAINFRTRVQTPEEWTRDWEQLRSRYPWLVASVNGKVVGVAYAAPWKPRNAYDWCTEATVYVANEMHRRGTGRALYRRLLALLDAQGYRTTVAVISLPNEPSVALHEAVGFTHVGTLRAPGYKLGAWHDVGFWQRSSLSELTPPGEILPVPETDGR